MDKLKLDLQRFAADPPTSGNLIDEDCLYEYHQNIESNFAKKNANNNFSTNQNITGDLTITGKFSCGTQTRNTTDTWMPVINSGVFDYTKRKFFTSKTHTNYNNDQDELATMSVLSWWNGAYGSNNASNLTYAHQGEIQCKPTQLYNNTTGTTGNVTLSETCANFTYVEVYYYSDNEYRFEKVYQPNGKTIQLTCQTLNTSTPRIFGKTKSMTFSGTSLNVVNYCQYTINNNAVGYLQTSNDRNTIYVTRVVGYK